MWLDKPLPKLGGPAASPNPGGTSPYLGSLPASSLCCDSLPPTTPRLRASSTFYSQKSDSSGASSSSSNQEVLEFRSPTSPLLMLYFKAKNSDKWIFVQIPMEEQLAIHHKRCCGNNMRRLFASPGETCCRRTVLESAKGKIEALMFSPAKGEPAWSLDVLQASFARARKSGERIDFKYVTIDHKDVDEKKRFGKAFEAGKKLCAVQRSRTRAQMEEAQHQAYLSRGGVSPRSRLSNTSPSGGESDTLLRSNSRWAF